MLIEANVMLVKIEGRHIERGLQCDSRRCPFALAVVEARGYDPDEFAYVWVNASWINIDGRVTPMPAEGREFVHAFDSKGRAGVEPLEVELPPWESWAIA